MVLPEPLGPTIAASCPGSTANDDVLTAHGRPVPRLVGAAGSAPASAVG